MKILFLVISFPDISKHSSLYSDLYEEFIKQGHEVHVVAPSLTGEQTQITKEKGYSILRVKTLPLFTSNLIVKGLANVLLPYQYKAAIKKFYNKMDYDLVLMPTPPITLVSVAKWIKKKSHAKFYLMLKDIFPQNAADLSMMKKSGLLYKYFRKQEINLYKVADSIGCMSQGNVDYVVKHNRYLDESKVHILRNSQKSNSLPIVDKELEQKYGLKGKFTLVFGGNMSVPQKMENVLSLAKACQERYDDVQFLLIGKGTQIEKIRNTAKELNIHNLILKDFVPRKEYQQLVSMCQVGLISLNEKFTIPNIPSKVMAYFDVAIPVLASIDENTDFGEILEANEMGLYCQAGDTEALLRHLDVLYQSPKLRKQMGLKGKQYLEEKMSPAVAVKTILKHV